MKKYLSDCPLPARVMLVGAESFDVFKQIIQVVKLELHLVLPVSYTHLTLPTKA